MPGTAIEQVAVAGGAIDKEIVPIGRAGQRHQVGRAGAIAQDPGRHKTQHLVAIVVRAVVAAVGIDAAGTEPVEHAVVGPHVHHALPRRKAAGIGGVAGFRAGRRIQGVDKRRGVTLRGRADPHRTRIHNVAQHAGACPLHPGRCGRLLIAAPAPQPVQHVGARAS